MRKSYILLLSNFRENILRKLGKVESLLATLMYELHIQPVPAQIRKSFKTATHFTSEYFIAPFVQCYDGLNGIYTHRLTRKMPATLRHDNVAILEKLANVSRSHAKIEMNANTPIWDLRTVAINPFEKIMQKSTNNPT